jgi:hypothetical protein
MKLVKSLLLGSAAGFAAISGASAADLPSTKAAPAEYVRVCSAYGAGFFYIPGTDVCLKVGGGAGFMYDYVQPFATAASPTGYRGYLRMELDARNPTAYGTLRTFVRLIIASRTGSHRSGTQERWGNATIPTAAADAGWTSRAQEWLGVDKAFVQWGGLVAGRTQSFFDFYNSPEIIGLLPASNLGSTNLVGYIATFGSGFYASVALEDAIMRRQAISNPLIPLGTTAYYAGYRMPDVVANLGVEQAWGKAQISGAVHQLPVVGPGGTNISSSYGWAVSGGVVINLPMIAPGDYLWLNASYSEGAMSYVHSGWFAGSLNNATVGNSNSYYQADAYYDVGTNSIRKSKTWSIAAAFKHNWSPTLSSGLFGGYANFNNPAMTVAAVPGGQLADWEYYVGGANLVWEPVRGLTIGGEVGYQYLKGKNVPAFALAAAGTNPVGGPVQTIGLKSKDGAWIARFRIQRLF